MEHIVVMNSNSSVLGAQPICNLAVLGIRGNAGGELQRNLTCYGGILHHIHAFSSLTALV